MDQKGFKEYQKDINVWQILEGPLHVDDPSILAILSDDGHPPEGAKYVVVASIENDMGEMEDANMWFEDKMDADEWISHLQSKIDPIVIKSED